MKPAGSGPRRTCIACRESSDKKQLVRFALDPKGNVLVDYRQRLPGRGVYTCFNPTCVDKAVKRQSFKRGFKSNCEPADLNILLSQLKQSVEQKILNLIGMGRKAGEITSGTNAVLDLLKNHSPRPW